jgi:hypothetical protein
MKGLPGARAWARRAVIERLAILVRRLNRRSAKSAGFQAQLCADLPWAAAWRRRELALNRCVAWQT